MAAKLEGDKTIKRELRIHGIEAPVVATFSAEGITLQVKGTRIPLQQGWVQIAQSMNTPANVPSYLMGYPYTFLQHQAKKSKKDKKKTTN